MDTSSLTLVVDDDETTRFLTCRLLQRAQVPGKVVEACNGQQALALLQGLCASAQPPQPVLVLVDINMPVMTGLEFLHHQQALPASWRHLMTTVVVSSSNAPTDTQQASGLACAYVTKPLTQPILHQLMQQHVAKCALTSGSRR